MKQRDTERKTTYDRPIFGGDGQKRGDRPLASVSGVKTPVMPKKTMSVNVKLLLFAVVVIAALTAVAYFALRPDVDTYTLDTFQFTTVGTRDFRNVMVGTGRVTPTAVVGLVAPADARVMEVRVQAGDDVAADSLIAVLTSESLQIELDKAKSDYDIAVIEADQARLKAEQEVEAARRGVERAQRAREDAAARLPVVQALFQLGGVSRHELDEAFKAVESADVELEEAQEHLQMVQRNADLGAKKAAQLVAAAEEKTAALQDRVDALHVRAPQAGRVIESNVAVGDRVNQGQLLFRIVDVNRQVIDTAVSPEQAGQLAIGTPAVVRAAGVEHRAAVSHVGALAVAAESTTQVAVTLAVDPVASAALLPYAQVSVELELGVLKNRPYVPRGPFFTTGNASFVYVLDPTRETARRQEVRYGAIDGAFIEVVSGLEPGDEFIFSSYTVFRSYENIQVVPEGGRRVEPAISSH